MKYILIANGNAIIDRKIRKRNILICDRYIADVDFSGEVPENTLIIDAQEKYVAPGFIDIHVHGGGGFDFMDCTPEAFQKIAYTHLINGTTTMLPTAVSADIADIKMLIDTYKRFAGKCPNLYGIHLEGPYISKNQKGAHNENLLRNPCHEETELLIDMGKGIIKRITAAPELMGMDKFVEAMTKAGVKMSIGHSDATSDIALRALKNGFSHITHLYSATPSVRKINEVVMAGVLEAAYLDDNATVELIADGKHAAVDAVKLAVKIKGIDKVCFVTDALRPTGTDAAFSWLGSKIPRNRIIIEDGVAKLPDRSSFAGSVATTSMLLEKGVNYYGLSVADTVTMLTETPAQILGIENKGLLRQGFAADIVIFGDDLKLTNVIHGGNIVK